MRTRPRPATRMHARSTRRMFTLLHPTHTPASGHGVRLRPGATGRVTSHPSGYPRLRMPITPDGRETSERGELRVSTIELFSDLVFVFTLTQLTALLDHSLTWQSVVRVVLIFVALFWMYGGYVWLTNQVPPDRAPRRLLLIGGMMAFFLCALAIPEAFESSGVAFRLGYLLVILVHAGL